MAFPFSVNINNSRHKKTPFDLYLDNKTIFNSKRGQVQMLETQEDKITC